MVIKMKDLIKAQTDELRKKFIWNEGEAPPEEAPAEPAKLKIDITTIPSSIILEEKKLVSIGLNILDKEIHYIQ